MNRLAKAMNFATKAHEGDKRKFSGDDYITHPLKVALIVSAYTSDVDTIIAAVLHDVVEDTEYTFDDIEYKFGETVRDLTVGMTKTYNDSDDYETKVVSELLRFKEIYDERVLLIKVADIFGNLSDYKKAPKKFLNKFVDSKKRLMGVIVNKSVVDNALVSDTYALIAKIEAYIAEV